MSEEQEQEIERLKKLIVINKYSADTLEEAIMICSGLPRDQLINGFLTNVGMMAGVLYYLANKTEPTEALKRNSPFMKMYNSYILKLSQ